MNEENIKEKNTDNEIKECFWAVILFAIGATLIFSGSYYGYLWNKRHDHSVMYEKCLQQDFKDISEGWCWSIGAKSHLN